MVDPSLRQHNVVEGLLHRVSYDVYRGDEGQAAEVWCAAQFQCQRSVIPAVAGCVPIR